MVYLFVGQDSFSKDLKLKKLKTEFLNQDVLEFNLDVLYAKDLTLEFLQERLLFLPFNSKKRIIVVKGAQDLKEDIKAFLLGSLKNLPESIILVLDIDTFRLNSEFIKGISGYAQVCRFNEQEIVDTFALSRCLEAKKTTTSLKILKSLLKNGERPERILGGLRASWERSITNHLELKKRLNFLLECDRDIKTGRINPLFALEKLIVTVCT